MTTQRFHLGAVLSMTTGKLLCQMEDIYRIAQHLAGEPVWTHQLGRVMGESRPHLLAQFLRDAMTDAQRYAWLRGNAVREKNLGDKFIEFHCDFESWNDIDAAIDKARIPCAHDWKVAHEGVQPKGEE